MPKLGTITANGDTSEVLIRGPFTFKANGTWDGGTFTVKAKNELGTYDDLVTPTALTSDATGQVLYDMPPNSVTRVKGTLAGATAPSLAWRFIGDVVDC